MRVPFDHEGEGNEHCQRGPASGALHDKQEGGGTQAAQSAAQQYGVQQSALSRPNGWRLRAPAGALDLRFVWRAPFATPGASVQKTRLLIGRNDITCRDAQDVFTPKWVRTQPTLTIDLQTQDLIAVDDCDHPRAKAYLLAAGCAIGDTHSVSLSAD